MSPWSKCIYGYKFFIDIIFWLIFTRSLSLLSHFHRDAHKSPSYWSSICLHNMAHLAREGTTVRRVLDPLFHSFDTEKYWFPEKGLAFSILKYLQMVLEESGYSREISIIFFFFHFRDNVCGGPPMCSTFFLFTPILDKIYWMKKIPLVFLGKTTDNILTSHFSSQLTQ